MTLSIWTETRYSAPMIRNIVQAEEETLRLQAAAIPVKDIPSKHIQQIIADMKETLRPENLGVAIAAPQIGESIRLFIISGKVYAARMTPREKYDPEKHADSIFINPEITRIAQKQKLMHEGCLSLRGKWGMVPRSEKLTVRGYDEHGKPFSKNLSGLLAHIVQHEVDHLNGIIYTDNAAETYDEEVAK